MARLVDRTISGGRIRPIRISPDARAGGVRIRPSVASANIWGGLGGYPDYGRDAASYPVLVTEFGGESDRSPERLGINW